MTIQDIPPYNQPPCHPSNPRSANTSATIYFTMRPKLSRSYVVPAIFLNPIIFLLSLNTILSRVLPAIVVDAAVQPPPFSKFGPSAEHPHLDIHASESLCWGYAVLIVCVQLVAFGRVSGHREEEKQRISTKRVRVHMDRVCQGSRNIKLKNGHGSLQNGNTKPNEVNSKHGDDSSCGQSDLGVWHLEGSEGYSGTTEPEILL